LATAARRRFRIIGHRLEEEQVPPDSYTLPQLSEALSIQYRTLHSWVERDLLRPGVQQSTGTGTRNLFSNEDAVMAGILVELRGAGVNFELLAQAAERLRETEGALCREAFMLVNGDVKIVFDRGEAAEALARGGLTLAYNTGDVLARFGASLN
jgi:DNA-binding transcriptional MerR regulator